MALGTPDLADAALVYALFAEHCAFQTFERPDRRRRNLIEHLLLDDQGLDSLVRSRRKPRIRHLSK